MRRTTIVLALAAVLVAGSLPRAAQEKEAPPPPGTPRDFVLPKPTRFTLPNGLVVTMVPFGVVPKVAVRLVVPAGNIDEAKDQVWLADLTGRMLREGTTARAADALANAFAGMGGELSVGVGPDRTNLGTDVLTERGPDAARLIAEVARQPLFPTSALARVKAALARDLAMQKSTPQSQAQERFQEALYPNHPYGRLFPTEAMLDGYTLDQVRSFHKARFGAARSRLYVAGVFDAGAMEQAVRQAFGAWDAGAAPVAAPPAAAEARRQLAVIDRPGAPQSTIYLGLRVPDPSQADWIALEVADSLLGGSFASRITTNIREQKGYTYSPYSSVNAHRRDAHWVEVADVTTAVTGAALKEIVGEIERLQREEPPAEELRGIQNNLAGTFVVRNSSRAGVISQLSFVDLHGLADDYLQTYVKRVMAVTPADVRRVAAAYLKADRMTLVVVGDRKVIDSQLTAYTQ
jgi:zinc protease